MRTAIQVIMALVVGVFAGLALATWLRPDPTTQTLQAVHRALRPPAGSPAADAAPFRITVLYAPWPGNKQGPGTQDAEYEATDEPRVRGFVVVDGGDGWEKRLYDKILADIARQRAAMAAEQKLRAKIEAGGRR
jgi:hypothetical protein